MLTPISLKACVSKGNKRYIKGMGELHIFAEIYAATDFDENSLFCKYSLNSGPNWSLVTGLSEGQTAADEPLHEGPVVWAHPLDLHYITTGIQGWPKIQLQVYCLDSLGRSWLVGYSCCAVPSSPGAHVLVCPCWLPAPVGLRDRLAQHFLGGSHQLLQPDTLAIGKDRYKLKTLSTGNVEIRIQVVMRHFSKFGVEYK